MQQTNTCLDYPSAAIACIARAKQACPAATEHESTAMTADVSHPDNLVAPGIDAPTLRRSPVAKPTQRRTTQGVPSESRRNARGSAGYLKVIATIFRRMNAIRVTSGRFFGQTSWQASVGLRLITIAQLPQMPARQTKSNWSDASCFSRISLSAMNSVMPSASWSAYDCMCGTLAGRIVLVVAKDSYCELTPRSGFRMPLLFRVRKGMAIAATPSGSRRPSRR
jgi:hypothetical protein